MVFSFLKRITVHLQKHQIATPSIKKNYDNSDYIQRENLRFMVQGYEGAVVNLNVMYDSLVMNGKFKGSFFGFKEMKLNLKKKKKKKKKKNKREKKEESKQNHPLTQTNKKKSQKKKQS
eukprot:TRINITY_DN925_c0_g2_i5.p6 TRINITY_DN925_c0_g2~~TRINITY_DN925_c0_g2_i5.p6  ORF type:complete len:119 (-),score=18.00 TRINITY_DN925_c0_g2_i5:38-394(-)